VSVADWQLSRHCTFKAGSVGYQFDGFSNEMRMSTPRQRIVEQWRLRGLTFGLLRFHFSGSFWTSCTWIFFIF
jgi:hypothetical protein